MQKGIKIYIKKQNLTDEIHSIRSDGKFYYVRYKSNKDKEFTYSPRNVKIIENAQQGGFPYSNLAKKRGLLTDDLASVWDKVRAHFIEFLEYCDEWQKKRQLYSNEGRRTADSLRCRCKSIKGNFRKFDVGKRVQ